MKATRGTETSKYPKEEKEKSIPIVAASEVGIAQTGGFGCRGCRTSIIKRKLVEESWKALPQKVKAL